MLFFIKNICTHLPCKPTIVTLSVFQRLDKLPQVVSILVWPVYIIKDLKGENIAKANKNSLLSIIYSSVYSRIHLAPSNGIVKQNLRQCHFDYCLVRSSLWPALTRTHSSAHLSVMTYG